MKSEWMVSKNPIAGKTFYQVYRLYDKQKIDHNGNRETKGMYETREEAERLAKLLNEEGK